MRLIDADRLSEAIHENVSALYEDAVCAKEDCLTEVYAAPTIDAVPVVRCRECKLHASSAFYPDMLFCVEHGIYVDPNGYCYLGERKEGADNA